MVNNRGRPTKQEELQLQEQFQKYYLQGISASFAAEKLGTDRKTAYSHYEKIHRKLVSQNDKNFFETAVANLEQAIICYDAILNEYFETLDIQNKRILSYHTNGESAPNVLIQTKIVILRDIRNVLKEKAQLNFKKPFEPSLEKKIGEVVARYEGSN